jgi:hypothetical protein
MNKQELRCGNLIYGIYEKEEIEGEFKSVCAFLGYDPFNDYFWVESEDGVEEFSGFEPIPLTEKWLKKFGYVIIETNKGVEAGYFGLRYSLSQPSDYNGWLFCDNETVLTNFTYVHELQNLIYSLTQTELTIKP